MRRLVKSIMKKPNHKRRILWVGCLCALILLLGQQFTFVPNIYTVNREEAILSPKAQSSPPTTPVLQYNQTKSIKVGQHVNVPPPESRIGPNGEKGYVHDPKFLLTSPRPLQFNFDSSSSQLLCAPNKQGPEKDNFGYEVTQKVRRHIETSQANRNVSLFCAVYTYSGGVRFTDAQSETWLRKCDGVLIASDKSNIKTGHMHLPSNSMKGFGYKGMIQRLRSIYAYVYDNFLDDYEFFHFCGDDTYVIVENLKEFLASEKAKQWEEDGNYLMAGFWANYGKMPEGRFYLAGGSGYTLSRKALKAYVEGPMQSCETKRDGSDEDYHFTDCVWKHITTQFIYTGDVDGSQRYHQGPVYYPIRYRIFRDSLKHIDRLPRNITGLPEGVEQTLDIIGSASNSSIAFHRHYNPDELRRLELLLYKNVTQECAKLKPGLICPPEPEGLECLKTYQFGL